MKNPVKLSFTAFAFISLIPGVGLAEPDRRFGVGENPAAETVYTLSNDPAGNEVLAFHRYGDGQMAPAGRFATGGTGTGSGLGNQGALALSENARYLFAVNAGSNDLSVFRIGRDGLELTDRTAEEGATPVSVAVSRNRVYVVNSGDDSVFGFRFDYRTGKLRSLPQSHLKLSGDGTAPAQISFDRTGDTLVVTEKATNKITTFSLKENGSPEARHSIDSAGSTPFGFAFGKRDQFFVSEAQGGAPNGATVSSYQLLEDGTVQLIDGAVAAGQTAACWLATTPTGRIAFTADTPANAISAFSIDAAGHLSLLHTRAAEENRPTDLAVSTDGRMLYALSGGDHSVGVYRILKGGALQKLRTLDGLPAGVTGLVVR
ncbi:beta-propeller fold lactonase family protein [Methylococcus sp. ANG]|uniref:lactonase family protein n=1 Tax=Methylococcus sp. ANG TaxID=3231903 RepID=UPI003459A9E0